jgi:hypothetical protein
VEAPLLAAKIGGFLSAYAFAWTNALGVWVLPWGNYSRGFCYLNNIAIAVKAQGKTNI